jgi:hypothetical protein
MGGRTWRTPPRSTFRRDPEADHQLANAPPELIISDSLAPVEVTDMAGDGGTDQLREQPPPAAYPRRPGLSAQAATGAMTGKTTGKTVAAAGLGYSGDWELDDQPGHACQ